ncbi:MAG: TonB-dependent receptor [Pseudomonas sp.]
MGLSVHAIAAARAEETASADAGDKQRSAVTLDDVVVTAERRETELRRTSVSVSAIGAQQLQERAVHTLLDLAGQAAGITLPSLYSNQQYVFIRGIGNSRPAGNPSVGIYLDDVYLARQFGNSYLDLPDIERVEVLRGPQGTLYGQNTSSGAIKITSSEPADAFFGSAYAGGGNYGAFESKLYLNGPLVEDTLKASLALSRRRNDGYYYNYTLDKRVNRYDTTQARLKLLYTPSDWLRLDFSLDETRDESDNTVATPIVTPRLRSRTTLSGWDTATDQKHGGASLKLTADLDPQLTFKSITAYRRLEDDQPWSDGKQTYASGSYKFQQYIDWRQFSQEFQLLGEYERFDFIVGANAYDEHFDFDRFWIYNYGSTTYSVNRAWNTNKSVGVFGQLRYRVSDRLGIIAGARYSRERHEQDVDAWQSNAGRELLAQTFAISGQRVDFDALTPKLSLEYGWSPDLFGYATLAKGQTSGGWNYAPVASATLATVPIDPEEVTSYELGLKSTDWGGRAQTNLSLFYNDYTGYQTNLTNPVIDGVQLTGTLLSNAGKAHTWGVELESFLQLSANLKTNLAASYLRTRFDEFLPAGTSSTTDYTGNELPYAPHLSASVGASYDTGLGSGSLRLNGSVRWSDKYYTGPENTYAVPRSTLVDAGVSYYLADSGLTFSFTVKNLLDKDYITPAATYYTYNNPRVWTAGVRYDF